jgi:hypothetical protein
MHILSLNDGACDKAKQAYKRRLQNSSNLGEIPFFCELHVSKLNNSKAFYCILEKMGRLRKDRGGNFTFIDIPIDKNTLIFESQGHEEP